MIKVYSDWYSQNKSLCKENHGPVVVQTAACGLEGSNDDKPPYFRKILINNKGEIKGYKLFNLKGPIKILKKRRPV